LIIEIDRRNSLDAVEKKGRIISDERSKCIFLEEPVWPNSGLCHTSDDKDIPCQCKSYLPIQEEFKGEKDPAHAQVPI
jgi:hypothetical protein